MKKLLADLKWFDVAFLHGQLSILCKKLQMKYKENHSSLKKIGEKIKVTFFGNLSFNN